MAALPLVRDFAPDGLFAYRDGRPLGVRRFLHDVARLACLLPERRHILNLCPDRYRFAVGFAAAMTRGQVSLLPPNQTPALMEQLARRYPDVYCLAESPNEAGAIDTVVFPELDERPGTPPLIAIPANQAAAIVFTSGSTGEPVANPKSWGSLVKGAAAESTRLGVRPGLALLGTVPPQHMYGLESTLLLAMQCGLALHAGRPFYPADIRAELAALPRPRGLVTTPVHLRALLAEAHVLPPLDFLLCATAPLAPQLAAAAETRFGAPLYEIYGCTEAGQVATRRTIETAEWHALADVALRQDEKGTWVKGGHVETEVLLSDVVELRGNRRFLLHGRIADLVNIAGKRTSIAHLNFHLNSIDGVHDGVFVMPDEERDGVTRLMAFVVAPGLTAERVLNALRSRIDSAFLPRPLCLVEALPRNTTGKLPREAVDGLVEEAALRAG